MPQKIKKIKSIKTNVGIIFFANNIEITDEDFKKSLKKPKK